MAVFNREYDDDKLIAAIMKRRPELKLGADTRIEDIELAPRYANSGEFGSFELKISIPLRWDDIDDVLRESEV